MQKYAVQLLQKNRLEHLASNYQELFHWIVPMLHAQFIHVVDGPRVDLVRYTRDIGVPVDLSDHGKVE